MKPSDRIDPAEALTSREGEVFHLLLQGMTAKEIARQLSITPSGVNYFVKRIYRKLQVKSRVQLILRYFEPR